MDENERLALCSDVVSHWASGKLADIEAILAIALITEPGERDHGDVAEMIKARLDKGMLN